MHIIREQLVEKPALSTQLLTHPTTLGRAVESRRSPSASSASSPPLRSSFRLALHCVASTAPASIPSPPARRQRGAGSATTPPPSRIHDHLCVPKRSSWLARNAERNGVGLLCVPSRLQRDVSLGVQRNSGGREAGPGPSSPGPSRGSGGIGWRPPAGYADPSALGRTDLAGRETARAAAAPGAPRLQGSHAALQRVIHRARRAQHLARLIRRQLEIALQDRRGAAEERPARVLGDRRDGPARLAATSCDSWAPAADQTEPRLAAARAAAELIRYPPTPRHTCATGHARARSVPACRPHPAQPSAAG